MVGPARNYIGSRGLCEPLRLGPWKQRAQRAVDLLSPLWAPKFLTCRYPSFGSWTGRPVLACMRCTMQHVDAWSPRPRRAASGSRSSPLICEAVRGSVRRRRQWCDHVQLSKLVHSHSGLGAYAPFGSPYVPHIPISAHTPFKISSSPSFIRVRSISFCPVYVDKLKFDNIALTYALLITIMSYSCPRRC
jgi:hypothetical protein